MFQAKQKIWSILLASALVVTVALACAVGSGGHLFALFDAPSQTTQDIILNLRLPRVLMAVLMGGALAVTGCALQGLFRNPLADPSLIGVSGGAAAAVALVIVLGIGKSLPGPLQIYVQPLAGILGGALATLLVYNLATSRDGNGTSVLTMLLAGIAVNAISAACVSVLSLLSNESQLRHLFFWSAGSLNAADWRLLGAVMIPVALAVFLLARAAPAINGFTFGETDARQLGVDTQKLKRNLTILCALITGICVATCGLIGFVALVAPHIARRLVGPDQRVLLPISALLGSLILVLADAIARTVLSPAELPIGILTALIGAPIFIVLLLRQRARLLVD